MTVTQTTQEPPRLFAAREPVFPRRVSGRFRTLKWAIMAATLGIYYVTPWLRWNRGPDMPDQAVLVDLAGRRFFFFMIEIWPHEFYLVAGLLVMAGLGLFLFTAALGRVWCGYACPQTVWTDLFILVERWIEGDRNARVRLWNAGWSLRKARLRAIKWSIWLLIALGTGGAWVFYFTDAPSLARALIAGQAHPAAWVAIGILTATTFAFGGFAREQICIYACPWPRIQAAMMDEDTLTVAYRDWRGEPRGKLKPALAEIGGPPGVQGDCIDCQACVNVCPMGIDIREGQQMACITCALCIDACDDVMDRVGRPRGLIGYLALRDEDSERQGRVPVQAWRHALRPRTVLYAVLWSAIGVGLVVALVLRSPFEVSLTPVRNPLLVMLSDGSIRNAYDLRLRNKAGTARRFSLSSAPAGALTLGVEGAPGGAAMPPPAITVPADQTMSRRVYLTTPPGSALATAGRTAVQLWVTDTVSGARVGRDTIFNGKAAP